MDNLVLRKALISYLPDCMKRYREMQEIARVEDMQFGRMDDCMNKILNNAFIEDADEYGIKKYESLLGIVPETDDSITSRRARVLLYWNNTIPYTYKNLIEKLNMYCGVNNYDVEADLEHYYLSLSIYEKINIEEIEKFLETMLPCNIVYDVHAAHTFAADARFTIVWQDDELFELKQAMK